MTRLRLASQIFLALILVFAAHSGLADSPSPEAAQAAYPAASYEALRAAFNDGKYDLALRQLQGHPQDDAVYYYNLGTTLLKLNHTGQAMAYLEKANRIQPHDVAIQQNLQLARTALSQSIGPDRLDPASTWLETLADNLRLDEIRGALGLVGFVIALFWIRCYLKTRKLRETLMKPAGWLGIGALAITAGLYCLERVSGANPVAVCLEHVSIRSGPGDTYVEVAEAEAGEKLRALGPTSNAAPAPAPSAEASAAPSLTAAPTGSATSPALHPSSSPAAAPSGTAAAGGNTVLWRQVRYSADGIGWVPASDLLIL